MLLVNVDIIHLMVGDGGQRGGRYYQDLGVSKVDWTTTFDFVCTVDWTITFDSHTPGDASGERGHHSSDGRRWALTCDATQTPHPWRYLSLLCDLCIPLQVMLLVNVDIIHLMAYVNIIFQLVIVKIKLTHLWGS